MFLPELNNYIGRDLFFQNSDFVENGFLINKLFWSQSSTYSSDHNSNEENPTDLTHEGPFEEERNQIREHCDSNWAPSSDWMVSYVTPEPVNMTASIPITFKNLYKYTLHTGKIVSYVISALLSMGAHRLYSSNEGNAIKMM